MTQFSPLGNAFVLKTNKPSKCIRLRIYLKIKYVVRNFYKIIPLKYKIKKKKMRISICIIEL